jgi:hypothetical protein
VRMDDSVSEVEAVQGLWDAALQVLGRNDSWGEASRGQWSSVAALARLLQRAAAASVGRDPTWLVVFAPPSHPAPHPSIPTPTPRTHMHTRLLS